MKTVVTGAKNMKKSSTAKARTGISLQLSGRDAVCRSAIHPDKQGSVGLLKPTPEAITVLTAMLVGLLKNSLSSDVVCLAMYSAMDDASKAGVSDKEFDRVRDIVLKKWGDMKGRNPIGGMFG